MTTQLIQALMYIYSKQVQGTFIIWGLPVKANWLPFVHLVISIFANSSIIEDIIGILAGHCYYFMKFECVRLYNKDYLPTPKFLYVIYEVG